MVEQSEITDLLPVPKGKEKGKRAVRSNDVEIFLVVALHCEARPLIEYFGLKKEIDVEPFEVFSSSGVTLIVSGTGKVRAAAATSFLGARQTREPAPVFFNAGIAGAPPEMEAKIGELYLVNRIVDAGSGRETVPDILVSTPLPESAVFTFDRPVTQKLAERPKDALVDMEASGFASAASFFAGPHAVGCAKVVSDALEGKRLSRECATDLMRQNVEKIVSHVEKLRRLQGCLDVRLTREERAWMEDLTSRLRLTKCQSRVLEDAVVARGALELGPLVGVEIAEIAPQPVKTKAEGKQALERARHRLLRA